MTVLSATLLALTLLGATDEAPSNNPKGSDVAPETRIEPTRPAEDTSGPHGRLYLGLRLHGPRFKLQGAGTRDEPLILDLPVGDLFKIRIVTPYTPTVRPDGNIDY